MKDLKQMLIDKGIDPTNVSNKEEMAELVCQRSKYKETCDDENGCSDGKVCNISTNPGICVDMKSSKKALVTFDYKGKKIVGNKVAMDILRKKLGKNCGPENDYQCSDGRVCDFENNKCIKEELRITAKIVGSVSR
jgi:hypothetical protein